jgi:hypothetical protein
MSNYFILLSFFSMQLMSMLDQPMQLSRFDSIIEDELNENMHFQQNHIYAKDALLLMAQEDQAFRREAVGAGRFYNKQLADILSQKHVMVLKKIINDFGWPSKESFDEDCSFAAWLIAQHANHDPVFQKKACLHISYLTERWAPIYWIFLTDRILVNENKPQLYGTQYTKSGALWPILNPENLEARRKKMQLEPMEYYQDIMAIKFNQLLNHKSPALPLR